MSFTLVIVGGGITGNWPSYVNRGIVLLVLACPCAIVIGIPIPAICAIGNQTSLIFLTNQIKLIFAN